MYNITLPNDTTQQRIALGLSALLGALLLYTVILIAQTWYSDWQLAHRPLAAPSSDTKNETALLIAALPDAHLFGQAFADGEVPITNLQLLVTGIVKVNKEEGDSKAYIAVENQPSKIFHVGDSLPDGVMIYDITQDAVILENNGQIEKLPLPRNKLQFKPRETEETP